MEFLNDGIKRKQSTINKINEQIKNDYVKQIIKPPENHGGFVYPVHNLVADEKVRFIQKEDGFYLEYKDIQLNKKFESNYDATVYLKKYLEKYLNPRVDEIVLKIFTQLKARE